LGGLPLQCNISYGLNFEWLFAAGFFKVANAVCHYFAAARLFNALHTELVLGSV
jgi:hypothetical protein